MNKSLEPVTYFGLPRKAEKGLNGMIPMSP